MNIKQSIAVFVCVCGIGGMAVKSADAYQIDPVHSAFLFRIKHLNTSYTHGRINTSSGTLTLDDADASKCGIELEVKADSVDTFNEKRDQHLKGPDFFNAKQFPSITFKSKSVKKSGDADYDVSGDFTLLGVTKEITVKFARVGSGKDPWGGARTGFEGTFEIKRSDYGMKAMLDGVGDDVRITVSVEAVKKA